MAAGFGTVPEHPSDLRQKAARKMVIYIYVPEAGGGGGGGRHSWRGVGGGGDSSMKCPDVCVGV